MRVVIKLFFTINMLSALLFGGVQLIKKQNSDSNTTLLVIGGIHGDEPGAYFAASILATHYKIGSKNLWIVPNLNQKSILEDKRGVNGDMNRKFSVMKKNDKDRAIVEEIKSIILKKNVSLVLNLHDGHGFYRKTDKGNIFNPNAWGQTCVIDQCNLRKSQPYGDLNKIAFDVKENINKRLIEEHHSFDVKNTKTRFEDEAMQLSLTYFAVTNNKPAFAIESSKNLSSLSQKVFYHLLAVEEFMNIMGISFSREFELDEESVDGVIKEYGELTINDNFAISLSNVKKSLSYVPIKSKNNKFLFTNPLGSVVEDDKNMTVYLGNKKITSLFTQKMQTADSCLENFDIIVDGKLSTFGKNSKVVVQESFNIVENDGYRVNAIGFKSKNGSHESGVEIKLEDFDKLFSVDNDEKIYRIEFYKGEDFCSMLKVEFK